VQSQVQHVPASHKQLLGLFGVSPQAAVLVASAMSALPDEMLLEPRGVMAYNPHVLPLMQWQSTDSTAAPATQTQMHATFKKYLEPQLQQWSDTPLRELLPAVLLYVAAHAAAGDVPAK
jgi:hypothetical protein